MLALLDVPPAAVRPAERSGEGKNRRPPHGCVDCGTRWDGHDICHCSICHQTFTSVFGFDRHKPSYDGCKTGHAAGLTQSARSNGFWATRGRGDR